MESRNPCDGPRVRNNYCTDMLSLCGGCLMATLLPRATYKTAERVQHVHTLFVHERLSISSQEERQMIMKKNK